MRHLVRTAVVLGFGGLGLVGAGCGSDGADGSPGADGAVLFVAKCGACHGVNARGTDFGPSLLSVVYEPNHHPDDSFRRAIAEGVAPHHWDFGPMAPVPGLSDAEVTAIIAHVRGLQQREGFEPYPPS